MRYCAQATKQVVECQTYRTKRGRWSFCSPAKVSQEICVATDQDLGGVPLASWLKTAVNQWKGITRMERSLFVAPRYHCDSYQYALTSSGLSAPTVDDKCSVVQSIITYFFG